MQQNQNEEIEFEEFDKNPACIHVILLNRTLRLLLVFLLSAILMPTFAYVYFFSKEFGHAPKREMFGTCVHPTLYHVACGVKNISRENCLDLECCFTSFSGCYHSLPSCYQYETNETWGNEIVLKPSREFTSYKARALNELNINVLEVGNYHLQINILDPKRIDKMPGHKSYVEGTKDYSTKVFTPSIFIEVNRATSNEILFSSARGPLIITKDFFEWTLNLGADSFLGLGRAFLEPGQKYVLLNNQRMSAIPLIIGYNSKSNKFHAVIFQAPGLLEIEVMKSKLIVIRSTFKGSFKVDVVTGPTPAEVYYQIKNITNNVYVPPFWGYGVQICPNSDFVHMKNITLELQELIKRGTAFETHCVHDNLFWLSNNLAVTKDLDAILAILKASEKKFVPSLIMNLEFGASPAYSLAKNILIKNPKGVADYIGISRGRNVSYVDWTTKSPELTFWLTEMWEKVKNLHADGYFLQDNWMKDDNNNTFPTEIDLVYIPENLTDAMKNLTLWNTTLSDSYEALIYSINNFGHFQTEAVKKFLKPSQILMTGSYNLRTTAGFIQQNISATWKELRDQVGQMMAISMSGFDYFGTPICGDRNGTFSEELCLRWYQFGSVLPLFRVRSDRAPIKFSKFAERAMNTIIRKRYSLLEYMSTILFRQETYLRPMYYQFQDIRNFTNELSDQFMVGEALLVAPVLFPKYSQIPVYFPQTFYELWGGNKMPEHRLIQFSVVETDLPLFIREGFTIPLHRHSNSNSVEKIRLQPIFLIAALTCNQRLTKCISRGSLIAWEGFVWYFKITMKEVTITIESETNDKAKICGTNNNITNQIDRIIIYGYPRAEKTIEQTINLNLCEKDWTKEIVFTIDAKYLS